MNSKQRALCCILWVMGFPCWPALCGISPARVEINLGPFPVDLYSENILNRDASFLPIIPSCLTCWSIRACVKGYFNNNPLTHPYNPFGNPNYRGQSVTGVRFLYDLGGGAYSTPFDVDASGNYLRVSQAWKDKLSTLL